MKLLIDPSGGMAGDMFAAALISAGADKSIMLSAMNMAAGKLGKTSLDAVLTNDGATRLQIVIDHKTGFLPGTRAIHLLDKTFKALGVIDPYRTFGFKALQILIDAEIKAHRENKFIRHHDHEHDLLEGSHPHLQEDAFLHEAQDILIDITGAAMGLQLLQAPVEGYLVSPVSMGGGYVTFSHGHLPVPAPATDIIFKAHNLSGIKGPIDIELCTPTGSALLAALNVKLMTDRAGKILKSGTSRGSKELPVPPLRILFCESVE